MTVGTELGNKMRRLADEGHERAEELRAKATEFDEKTAGYYGDPQTVSVKSFMGAFARARRLWCDCTGEPLV